MKSGGKELTDEEIREELLKSFELSDESLEKVAGGRYLTPEEEETGGDTREVYSMNQEDINRSIFGELFF